ncbi:MAG: hypothetical protein VB858_14770 [Planctomycetaceae bacterium]
MGLVSRLERKFGRYAIPNLTMLIIAGQVVLYLLWKTDGDRALNGIFLQGSLVLAGEWWRLISFVFMPPDTNPIFLMFGMLLFYLMGNALESQWGAFRYNLYLLVGYLATIAVTFVYQQSVTGNLWVEGSVFLAFAFLYPDFQIHVMFLFPVKVRWLALITWAFNLWFLCVGDWYTRATVLAGILNFILFFRSDIVDRIRTGNRKMRHQASRLQPQSNEAFHTCTQCGRSDLSNPNLEFRYCSTCSGNPCFCEDHIGQHEHVREDA